MASTVLSSSLPLKQKQWLSSLVELLRSLDDLHSIPHDLLLMIEEYTMALPTLLLFGTNAGETVRRSYAPVRLTIDCSSPLEMRGAARAWSLPTQAHIKQQPLVNLKRLWQHLENLVPHRDGTIGVTWRGTLYCMGTYICVLLV